MSAPCPVLGFVVRIKIDATTGASDVHALREDLIALMEDNGLVAAEGHPRLQFVIHRDGTQAIEQDREIIQSWASRWKRCAEVDVGPLTDLNPTA